VRRIALALVALLAACSDRGGGQQARPPTAVVSIFASTSLTDAFSEIGVEFGEENPGVRVDFTFASASVLLDEVGRGKAAAVLATADDETMREAVDGGHARVPRAFARNHLALVVPAGNPEGITGVADLARADLTLGLCEPDLPCGVLALDALADAGVDRAATATGPSSRAVLVDVTNGALDAALVYATTPGDGVHVVADLVDRESVYEISVLAGAVDRDGAQAFVEFVLGPDGQAILAEHGFEPA
jgi:molybdate transport system substrate-binding protein